MQATCADSLDDIFGMAAMSFAEHATLGQAFLAFVWSCKDHRLIGPVQVYEDSELL
jgi:hypothetical protein